jgi:FKBP-type peptidyl-prolyl cis-trans isomerase FkpA
MSKIDAYIKRRGWEMQKTGTGLRYFIYEKGTGEQASEGKVAEVNFTLMLLNGDTAYTNINGKPQQFLIGMDNVESGLHEGITYMQVGDKAKLILPSHLAHGLIGDLNKIPPRASLVYDIELIDLK